MDNILTFNDFIKEGLFSKDQTDDVFALQELEKIKSDFDIDQLDWEYGISFMSDIPVTFEYKNILVTIPQSFALGLEKTKGSLTIDGNELKVSNSVLYQYGNFLREKVKEIQDRKKYKDGSDYLRKTVYRKKSNI